MIDTTKLLTLHAAAFPPALDPQSAANFDRLAQALDADPAMQDVRWRAYALATVRRECGRDYQIRSEAGGQQWCARYEPVTQLGKALGNTQAGDGYRYRGRGYVQITGRSNYAHFSGLVEVDLLADPDAALRPEVAYQVMSFGMVRGLFTGAALRYYINAERCDYKLARKIINGQDHAEEIAGNAVVFQEILEACVLVPSLPVGVAT